MKLLILSFIFILYPIQRIERPKLLYADHLEGRIIAGTKVNIFKGNVATSYHSHIINCDSSYQYENKSYSFFGSITLQDKDTTVIESEILLLNIYTGIGTFKNNVKIYQEGKITTMDSLDYNFQNKTFQKK